MLQGFDQNSFQELNDQGILRKFLKDFNQNSGGQVSNNSDDYVILQELDDHGILMKFFQDLNQNYFQELDDHRILMKFIKDFDQNSGCQP